MYKTTLLIVNVIFEGHARVIIKKKSRKSCDLQDFGGERGSRTYGFLEYHKIHKYLYISYL